MFLGSAIPTITGYQEALQAMFADAGINVEIKSVERAQTTDELLAGDWDLYMNFFPGSADPWLTYNAFFGPDSIWFPGEAPAAVIDLMAQAETETESEVRAGVFEELAQAVDDESARGDHLPSPPASRGRRGRHRVPGQRPRCPAASRDRQGRFLRPHRAPGTGSAPEEPVPGAAPKGVP